MMAEKAAQRGNIGFNEPTGSFTERFRLSQQRGELGTGKESFLDKGQLPTSDAMQGKKGTEGITKKLEKLGVKEEQINKKLDKVITEQLTIFTNLDNLMKAMKDNGTETVNTLQRAESSVKNNTKDYNTTTLR